MWLLHNDEIHEDYIKNISKRINDSPVTAEQMKKMNVPNGNIRIFAGGKTLIDTDKAYCKNFIIHKKESIIIKSRGIIDVEYYDKPFTFKREMWGYQGKENICLTKYLYYFFKTKNKKLREKSNIMGSMPQIKLEDTEEIKINLPPICIQKERR